MEEMRYAAIEECEIVNGEDVGMTIWVQGCPHHCEGCFNPETWDFNGGQPLTGKEESEIYQNLRKGYVKRCSWSGGEPLVEENLHQLAYMLVTIRSNFPDIKIWIWTGYTWDQLQERLKDITKLFIVMHNIDYLVAGPFIQEQKDLTLQWRGSRNQEVIDVKETLKF